jgi:uncharacterized protein (DUF983 family)
MGHGAVGGIGQRHGQLDAVVPGFQGGDGGHGGSSDASRLPGVRRAVHGCHAALLALRTGVALHNGLFCDTMTSLTKQDRRMAPIDWQPDRTPTRAVAQPSLATAIGRGVLGRCPVCGGSQLFNGFLRVVKHCGQCDAPLGRARADDAPPYFTILVTGHIVVPLMMYVDRLREPSILTMAAIFLPLTLLLALGLLRPIKGGTVGLMVNLNMLQTDPTETPTGA